MRTLLSKIYRWLLKIKRSLLHFFDKHSFRPKAFVILYHRVNNLSKDPLALAVSPENFESQLLAFKNNFEIISLLELVNRIQSKSLKGGELVITFDDGYKDNLMQAFPIAKKLNVPIAIFISTGILDKSQSFWWDAEYSNTKEAYLSNDDIKTLSQESLVTLGSHTVTHPRLRDLNSDTQKAELLNSKNTLENILNETIEYFAYPFGDYPDFTLRTVSLVKKVGYKAAFSNVQRVVTHKNKIHKIPRILAQDLSGEMMLKKLKSFTG